MAKGDQYCLCSRCRHRWIQAFKMDPEDYRDFKKDPFTGDVIYEPPKRVCPSCGSRHNVRTIPALANLPSKCGYVENLDPLTGEDLYEAVANSAGQ